MRRIVEAGAGAGAGAGESWRVAFATIRVKSGIRAALRDNFLHCDNFSGRFLSGEVARPRSGLAIMVA